MTKLSKNLKIALLAGGISDEREVSLESGKMIFNALKEGGYRNVLFIDVGFDLDLKLREFKPDVVVNGLHGAYGEDGAVQGLLEMMKIPYTNSGVTASAVGMDKTICRAVMKYCGIKIAEEKTIVASEDVEIPLDFPFVLKDPLNGSSRGVSIIKDVEGWKKSLKELKRGKRYLCESFFKGREINVAVLNDKVLGSVEITPANEFYDFDAKYRSDKTLYTVDPEIDEKVKGEIENAALKLHLALGCKGVTRSDFIVNGGDYVMLEINTLPGMTTSSLVPMIAKKKGINYLELLEILISESIS